MALAACWTPERWPLALIGIVLGSFLAAIAVTAAPAVGRTPVEPSQAAEPPAEGLSIQEHEYIGEADCAICHRDQTESSRAGAHARVWEPRSPAAARACETCHGPGQAHFEDPEVEGRIRNFTTMAPRDVSETCLACHNRQEHALWQGSMHDSRNVTCVSCHSMHEARSEPLLQQASVTQTCAQCHRDKAAKLQRAAHMPVREGKMECSTCHNPHGSTNVRLLRAGNTVNETCTSCHAEKRGPFLWEHAPVRESCVTCHDPHGTSNDRMLVARAPMLCQRCHIATRHPSTAYDEAAFGTGNVHAIGRACVNCHSNIHGSNHPAGAMFQR